MSARARGMVVLAALALSWVAVAAAPADPTGAPRDTALGGYLDSLSDSTDRWFGRSAEPADTAGLDTLPGALLVNREDRLGFGGYPRFEFNRCDGVNLGLALKVDGPRPWGSLTGRAGWTRSSKERLGSLEYSNRFVRGRLAGWQLRVRGGRETAGMNRERMGGFFTALRGFLYGSDYTHYLRRDGVEGRIEYENDTGRLTVGYRDQLESALAIRTTWNLFHHSLAVPFNLPATTGRAHEVELGFGLRLPRLPVRTEATWQGSGPALGSAFRYDRYRAAAGAELTLGRSATLIPQASYARVTGGVPPQAAFYLGGGTTLRSLHRDVLGGTGAALGRLDLIGARDVLTLLHLHHSPTLRITPAVFGAIGAVWGEDPYGGPARPGTGWPDRNAWLSEAGAALQYELGAFGTQISVGYAVPVGPTAGRTGQLILDVTHPLSLLRPPREP